MRVLDDAGADVLGADGLGAAVDAEGWEEGWVVHSDFGTPGGQAMGSIIVRAARQNCSGELARQLLASPGSTYFWTQAAKAEGSPGVCEPCPPAPAAAM